MGTYLAHYGVKGMTWDKRKTIKEEDEEKRAKDTVEKMSYTKTREKINRNQLAKSEAKAEAAAKRSLEDASRSEFERLANEAPERPEDYDLGLKPSTFGNDVGYVDDEGVFYVGNKKQALDRAWKRAYATAEINRQAQKERERPIAATVEKAQNFIKELFNKKNKDKKESSTKSSEKATKTKEKTENFIKEFFDKKKKERENDDEPETWTEGVDENGKPVTIYKKGKLTMTMASTKA
jgi:hypothetical protein